MHAANLLAGRFNPVGKFIRAWNQVPGSDTRGWAIIDCMFNICLLYWASEESADPRFRQIAMMHADTVMENFIRPDGSVCHIVEFDPETGVMVKATVDRATRKALPGPEDRAGHCTGLPTAIPIPANRNIWIPPKSSTLLHRQHPGEWYYSRRLPSAHAAGLGGFLRCMYHCRWSLRGSEACTGAGERDVHPCSG